MSDEHEEHSVEHYTKIAITLMILAVVSFLGPKLGIFWLTMVTAFGIATVKAYLVIKHFMHLTVERKYVIYFMTIAVAFMCLLYAGTAPDVMNHEGRNWVNVAAKAEIERANAAHAAEAAEGGGEHH